uniref:Uncharacterized protein n=1 Tax=Actinobacteria phage HS02 TaxID=3056388 RepID=A0AA49X2Z6_9VIRU|nr:MAG: hypothetical protein [Actinobacteria phage HS02]
MKWVHRFAAHSALCCTARNYASRITKVSQTACLKGLSN